MPIEHKLKRLLRFGYAFGAFFGLMSIAVIWCLPLLAMSLGVTAFLISDAFVHENHSFNIRPLVIIASAIAVVFFAIFYAILGLGLDLQTTDVAKSQAAGYLELAKSFGLMSATGLITLTVLGILAIIRAHLFIRGK